MINPMNAVYSNGSGIHDSQIRENALELLRLVRAWRFVLLYKIIELLRALSLVRCVLMRVCKHGYDVLDSRVFLTNIYKTKRVFFPCKLSTASRACINVSNYSSPLSVDEAM